MASLSNDASSSIKERETSSVGNDEHGHLYGYSEGEDVDTFPPFIGDIFNASRERLIEEIKNLRREHVRKRNKNAIQAVKIFDLEEKMEMLKNEITRLREILMKIHEESDFNV